MWAVQMHTQSSPLKWKPLQSLLSPKSTENTPKSASGRHPDISSPLFAFYLPYSCQTSLLMAHFWYFPQNSLQCLQHYLPFPPPCSSFHLVTLFAHMQRSFHLLQANVLPLLSDSSQHLLFLAAQPCPEAGGDMGKVMSDKQTMPEMAWVKGETYSCTGNFGSLRLLIHSLNFLRFSSMWLNQMLCGGQKCPFHGLCPQRASHVVACTWVTKWWPWPKASWGLPILSSLRGQTWLHREQALNTALVYKYLLGSEWPHMAEQRPACWWHGKVQYKGRCSLLIIFNNWIYWGDNLAH